jgi:hypothetical protein
VARVCKFQQLASNWGGLTALKTLRGEYMNLFRIEPNPEQQNIYFRRIIVEWDMGYALQ